MRRLLAAVLLCAGAAVTSAQDADLEYRVKAAYLFNFTKFIEWPSAAFVGGRSFSFSICVAGRNPFGPALTTTLIGETAAGLPLAARVVNAGGAAGCHVLFVPAGVAAGPYLRNVDRSPVLTVGESPDFLADGGIINFVRDGGRVRFEINQAAAERAQLRISSRLLQLGRASEPRGGD
jgi:hypothetical protein